MENKLTVKLVPGVNCNQCCDYCDVSGVGSDLTSLDSFTSFMEKISPDTEIHLAIEGGDAMNYPDVVKACLKYKVPTVLFTNGTQITQDILDECHEDVVFRISLDGPRDIHSAHRVLKEGESGDGFDRTIEGIDLVKANGFKFYIATTITTEASFKLEEIKEFIMGLEPDRWILTPQMFKDERAMDVRSKTAWIWAQAEKTISTWSKELPIVFPDFSKPKSIPERLFLEVLFMESEIQINMDGYQTPTLKIYGHNEVQALIDFLEEGDEWKVLNSTSLK